MGIVIRFPQERRLTTGEEAKSFTGSATIIILPAVRIERHGEAATVPELPNCMTPNAQHATRRRIAVQPAP